MIREKDVPRKGEGPLLICTAEGPLVHPNSDVRKAYVAIHVYTRDPGECAKIRRQLIAGMDELRKKIAEENTPDLESRERQTDNMRRRRKL